MIREREQASYHLVTTSGASNHPVTPSSSPSCRLAVSPSSARAASANPSMRRLRKATAPRAAIPRVPPMPSADAVGSSLEGSLALGRQAVDLRLVDQEEERVQPADDVVVRAVEVGILRLSRSRACALSCCTRSLARSCSSSIGPNWIDAVGQALAQAGASPPCSRS